MRERSARSIEAAIQDVVSLERAIITSRRRVILRHRQLNVPLVIWRDGKVVEVPPESVELPALDDNADGHK